MSKNVSEFVVDRIDHHRDRHAATAEGDVVTTWAVPELAAIAVLTVVAVIAQILR